MPERPTSVGLVEVPCRRFIRVEGAMSLQARAQEPRVCRRDGRLWRTRRAVPVVARCARSEGQGIGPREGAKPGRGGARVDEAGYDAVEAGATCGGGVLASVEQDVAQGELDCSRGGQRASVVAVGEQAALALELPIDGAGDADREALKASRQSPAVVGFSDEMDVV